MDKMTERRIIIALVLILFFIGISGCGVKTIKHDVPREHVPTELETIGNLGAIGYVLGCIFDPTPCQEKKQLQETEDNKND